MQFNLDQLVIPAGHQVLLKNIDWQTFESICDELAKAGKNLRFSYSKQWMELMSPLAVHEDDKGIISDLVKVLLEGLDIEFRALGSMTLKNKKVEKAVEPDECFYIQHEAIIRGKERIDLAIDPAPDLAIEIDITNRTHLDNYEVLGIPELWRFDGKTLEILVLIDGCYKIAEKSRQFSAFPIRQLIPAYLAKSKIEGRNTAIKAFRRYLASALERSKQ
jgi:Uma2 family endonuclease